MNTFLSSAQEATKEQYLSFAREAVAPVIRELESHKVCLKDFLQNLGQKGYLAISVPKEYGGQGLPYLNCALFVEAICQYEAGLGLTLANHFAVIETLKQFATENQKSRYLPLLARGEMIATLAFSEEQAGTDFTAVETKLSGEPDKLELTGKKQWVVTGDFAQLYLTLAKNLESATDELAVVLLDCGDKEGLKISPDCARLGLRSAYVNNIEFQAIKLSKEAELAASGKKAAEIAVYAMDVAKVILSAAAIGLSRAAETAAVEHARLREQFGTKIGQFQGIQWKLADMATELTAALLQVYRAAWSLEGDPDNFSKNAAMTKWYASKVARFVSGEAVQILGASGVSEENLLEKLYRDAKVMEICLGTSEAQKLQLVELLEI